MAKINATYSSGYYLAPDTDYRKLEEQQQRERKRRRQEERDGDADASAAGGAIRQTFAIPFNVICLHCNRRIARGTHGYVNRRPTKEKFMGIRIWELEFRCIFCKRHIYLTTDYETAKLTGGYHCSRNCRRGEGDFYGTNQINEAIRAKQATEEAEKGSLDALERENEAMRQLQERERLIEELVESRAATEEEQTRDELLQAIQARKRGTATRQHEGEAREEEGEETGDPVDKASADDEDDAAYRRFEAQLRYWQEEAERALQGHPRGDAGAEDKVAATITAKYTDHGDKRRNVFMGGSDSGSDTEEDKGGRGPPMMAVKKDPGRPLVAAAGTTSTTTTKRRNGSALASLLDDL
ncbi:uncharacterized protein Tco025E_02122 [Trypanosoma conorhini]|uniref:Splicing factor YJU2 n=1 Tax=Trypanosoma conorhini TaxID=83891 RepID=A0A422Q6P3_9TRYP|nr:uncharacterized protein Tco025E_02122 [Trypanosoma conorhini]RNF25626.1 hypothetical protein Tco025E_02122 [Trypanosoma conorhini]